MAGHIVKRRLLTERIDEDHARLRKWGRDDGHGEVIGTAASTGGIVVFTFEDGTQAHYKTPIEN